MEKAIKELKFVQGKGNALLYLRKFYFCFIILKSLLLLSKYIYPILLTTLKEIDLIYLIYPSNKTVVQRRQRKLSS